jgi:hypothetical protein
VRLAGIPLPSMPYLPRLPGRLAPIAPARLNPQRLQRYDAPVGCGLRFSRRHSSRRRHGRCSGLRRWRNWISSSAAASPGFKICHALLGRGHLNSGASGFSGVSRVGICHDAPGRAALPGHPRRTVQPTRRSSCRHETVRSDSGHAGAVADSSASGGHVGRARAVERAARARSPSAPAGSPQ